MPSNSYRLDIDLGNYKSIQKAEEIFGKLSEQIDDAVYQAVLDTAYEMEMTARDALDEQGLGGSEVGASLRVDTDSDRATLVADSDHADFVEYGTGIRGEEEPHPMPKAGWEYDTNGHGEDGWFYYDEKKKLHWTAGMPSRPFMYPAWRRGSAIVGAKVRKEINKLFRGMGL